MFQEELRTIEKLPTREAEQRTTEDAGISNDGGDMLPKPLTSRTPKEVHQGPPAVPPRRRLSPSSSGHSAATLGDVLEEAARSATKRSEGESSLEEGGVPKFETNSAALLKDGQGEETWLASFKGEKSMLSPTLPRAHKKVLYEMWRDPLESRDPRVLPSSTSSTDKWEVPRERLSVRDFIGVGAFGEVRKAVLKRIGGRNANMVVAVKIIKGMSFMRFIRPCVCLVSSVLKKSFFFKDTRKTCLKGKRETNRY